MHRTIVVVGFLAIAPALVMAEDIGDTLDGAKKTSISGRVKETLSSPTDVDFIRVSVGTDRDNPERDTSGNITVNFSQKSPPGTNPQAGWRIELYSEQNLAQSLYTATMPETTLQMEFEQGLSPGTYYYKVSSLDSVVFPAAEYTLKGNWEQNSHYEKPANDKPETATAMAVNETYFGNLSSVGDIDVYRFSLLNPDSVIITLSQDVPGADPSIGWRFGLLSQYEGALNVSSVEMAGTLSVPLEAGLHYIFVTALPAQEGQTSRAPIGRGYQIKVDAPSVAPPPAESECPFIFTYGQNPQTGRWASFSNPCDVPAGWFSQQIPPETSEVCPSPHASYTPPLVDANGVPKAGKLKIPLVDIANQAGKIEAIFRVEMQEVPRPADNSPFQFELLQNTIKLIRAVQQE